MSLSSEVTTVDLVVHTMRTDDPDYGMTPLNLVHAGAGPEGSFAALLALTQEYLDYLSGTGYIRGAQEILEQSKVSFEAKRERVEAGLDNDHLGRDRNELERRRDMVEVWSHLLESWGFLKDALASSTIDRTSDVTGTPLAYSAARSDENPTWESTLPELLANQGPFLFSSHEVKVHEGSK